LKFRVPAKRADAERGLHGPKAKTVGRKALMKLDTIVSTDGRCGGTASSRRGNETFRKGGLECRRIFVMQAAHHRSHVHHSRRFVPIIRLQIKRVKGS
jgi:hypothetical protein